jgi:hypothetical protein
MGYLHYAGLCCFQSGYAADRRMNDLDKSLCQKF